MKHRLKKRKVGQILTRQTERQEGGREGALVVGCEPGVYTVSLEKLPLSLNTTVSESERELLLLLLQPQVALCRRLQQGPWSTADRSSSRTLVLNSAQ